MKEEIDTDIELDRMDDNSGDENLYTEFIVNNTGKIENMLSQMEEWSILSDLINYVQYSRSPKNFYAMSIKPINKNKVNVGRKEKDKSEFSLHVDLVSTSDKSTEEEYLDRYERDKSGILKTTGFDENFDLSMISLGRSSMTRNDKMIVEEKFSNNRARIYSR